MTRHRSIVSSRAALQLQARRDLEVVAAKTGLRCARIQSKGEIEAARAESIRSLVSITQMAQVEVARVTEELAGRNPRIIDQLLQAEQLGNGLLFENLLRGSRQIGGWDD